MIFLPLFLATLANGAGPAEVVARVDDVAITRAALIKRLDATRRQPRPPAAEQMLDALINEALLASEARRLGLENSQLVKQLVDSQKRRAAAEVLVEDEVVRHQPGEDKLRELFHGTSDFVSFESLTFETPEAAAAALKRVKAGATFASEAKNAVTSQLYEKPESAPPFMRAQLEPAFGDALFAAAPGALVGPVRLSVGVAIARPIRKEIGTTTDYAARRPSLLEYANKQIRTAVRQRLAKRERELAKIKLDESFLQSLGKGAPTAQQLEHPIATVHGRAVPYRAIEGQARAIAAASGHGSGAAVKIQLAWQQIDALLVEDLAVQRGLDKAPEVNAQAGEFERAALAAAALEKIRASAPSPSEREIQGFYKRNAARYGRPFREVLADAAARAAAEKQDSAVDARLAALRKKASISIDKGAVARASSHRA